MIVGSSFCWSLVGDLAAAVSSITAVSLAVFVIWQTRQPSLSVNIVMGPNVQGKYPYRLVIQNGGPAIARVVSFEGLFSGEAPKDFDTAEMKTIALTDGADPNDVSYLVAEFDKIKELTIAPGVQTFHLVDERVNDLSPLSVTLSWGGGLLRRRRVQKFPLFARGVPHQ